MGSSSFFACGQRHLQDLRFAVLSGYLQHVDLLARPECRYRLVSFSGISSFSAWACSSGWTLYFPNTVVEHLPPYAITDMAMYINIHGQHFEIALDVIKHTVEGPHSSNLSNFQINKPSCIDVSKKYKNNM